MNLFSHKNNNVKASFLKFSVLSHSAGFRTGHYTYYASQICNSLKKQGSNFELFASKGYNNEHFLIHKSKPLFSVNETNIKSSKYKIINLFNVLKFYRKAVERSSGRPLLFLEFLPPPFELFLLPFFMLLRKTESVFFILHRNPFSKDQRLLHNIYNKIFAFLIIILSRKGFHFFTHVKELLSHVKKERENFDYVDYGIELVDNSKIDNNHTDRLKLLFFGGLNSQKGIFELIKVVSHLINFEVSLTIVGKCSFNMGEKLKEYINPYSNIKINLEYISEDAIRPLFESHHCLVLPYRKHWNATSGPLHLAVQYNTPVIVNNVPQLSYIVSKYELGIVNESNGITGLAKAIIRMKSTKNEYYEKISISKKYLSFDNLARKLEKRLLQNNNTKTND